VIGQPIGGSMKKRQFKKIAKSNSRQISEKAWCGISNTAQIIAKLEQICNTHKHMCITLSAKAVTFLNNIGNGFVNIVGRYFTEHNAKYA
jgi:hypothetical protein